MHRMKPGTAAMVRGVLARRGVFALAAMVAIGCEGSDVHATAPRGSDAFARFEVIGGAFAAGRRSDGLVSSTQSTAWPALLASAAGVTFAQPLHRAPGCAPPLVAPLILGERLSGSSTAVTDSSCTAAGTPFAPPGNNLALADASTWDALHLTPKDVAAAPGLYGVVLRSRYQAVLALTQSQVTAMLVSRPTFVAVDLGLGDVIRAATTGVVVTASAYRDPVHWTLAPAALVIPALDTIADSVAKSGAKAVVLSVPRVAHFPAFRPASGVWSERAALRAFGVVVDSGCATSTNVVNVARLVPILAGRAVTAAATQALTCADVPGTEDGILTGADVAAIDATVDAINDHLKAIAEAHGWAFADLGALYAVMAAAAGPYSASAQLVCGAPYGSYLSLDGINPSAAGQQRIADAVAAAINERYGFSVPVVGEKLYLPVAQCGEATAAGARDRSGFQSSFVRANGLDAKGGPRHGERAWLH